MISLKSRSDQAVPSHHHEGSWLHFHHQTCPINMIYNTISICTGQPTKRMVQPSPHLVKQRHEPNKKTGCRTESDGRGSYVFGPESQTDQPSRKSLKKREASDQSDRNRRLQPDRRGKHRRDDTVLNHELHSLCHLGGPGPPGLYAMQILNRQSVIA